MELFIIPQQRMYQENVMFSRETQNPFIFSQSQHGKESEPPASQSNCSFHSASTGGL